MGILTGPPALCASGAEKGYVEKMRVNGRMVHGQAKAVAERDAAAAAKGKSGKAKAAGKADAAAGKAPKSGRGGAKQPADGGKSAGGAAGAKGGDGKVTKKKSDPLVRQSQPADVELPRSDRPA
jgi:hypothetical protein